MIYFTRRYGLVQRFELDENRLVLWHGDRPDGLIASRAEMATIYGELMEKGGGRFPDMGDVQDYLVGLMDQKKLCRVGKRIKFSDI